MQATEIGGTVLDSAPNVQQQLRQADRCFRVKEMV